MIFNREKFITTLSTIFIIFIFSSTNIQGMMDSKLRKLLVENLFIKHTILLSAIFTSKTYEIINFTGEDNENDIRLNIIKTFLIWVMLLFFFKIEVYCILIIIILTLSSSYIKGVIMNKNIKSDILLLSNYLILFIYIYGVSKYLMESSKKSKKSIINSIFKTIN